MVFVDTGAWFALYVPADPLHQEVTAWFGNNTEPLMTTDYCVDETLTLLIARRRIPRAVEVGRAIFEQQVAQLHFVEPDQVHRAWTLFRQRAASGWSFTDCTSRIVIGDLKITRAVALDEHFREFGIEVVP